LWTNGLCCRVVLRSIIKKKTSMTLDIYIKRYGKNIPFLLILCLYWSEGFEVFKSFWCILFSSSIYLFLFCNTIFSLASLPGPNTGSKCIPTLARHFATIVAHYCTVSYIREWNAKVSKSETYIFFIIYLY